MAKDQAPTATMSGRAGRNVGRGPQGKPPVPSAGKAPAEAAPKKPRTNPIEFFKQVRAEARKTTWTSPKETWITSVMVFIMVIVAVLFFFVVDWSVSFIVQQVIKIGA